jgi:parvulin-like peptidyl-prolyl isomerase
MAEPFAAAAYAQDKDKVGDPVKTEFGIHIIKVTDRRKATETEKQQAYSMLLQVKFADLMADVERTVKVERLFKQDEEKTPASDDEDSSAKDAG